MPSIDSDFAAGAFAVSFVSMAKIAALVGSPTNNTPCGPNASGPAVLISTVPVIIPCPASAGVAAVATAIKSAKLIQRLHGVSPFDEIPASTERHETSAPSGTVPMAQDKLAALYESSFDGGE